MSRPKHSHAPSPAASVGIGDPFSKRSSRSLKKSKPTTSSTQAQAHAKRKLKSCIKSCSLSASSRRVSFVSVECDDGSNWKIGVRPQWGCGVNADDLALIGVLNGHQADLISGYEGYCNIFRPFVTDNNAADKGKTPIRFEVPTVDLTDSVAERTFFDCHVLTRCPAKITGPVRGAMWEMMPDQTDRTHLWRDLAHLNAQAGGESVHVEIALKKVTEDKVSKSSKGSNDTSDVTNPSSSPSLKQKESRLSSKDKDRSSKKEKAKKSAKKEKKERRAAKSEGRSEAKHSFGHGKRQQMTFSNFLMRVASGDEHLYLTAQPMEAGMLQDRLLDPPLRGSLMGEFPKRPKIFGPLLPYRYNLWMGQSKSTTTGLHVDFHDNLYKMISGTKTFRIYSPAMLTLLEFHGRLESLFPSGLPYFSGNEPIRADGSILRHAIAWKLRSNLRSNLALVRLPNAEELMAPIVIPEGFEATDGPTVSEEGDFSHDEHKDEATDGLESSSHSESKKAGTDEGSYPDYFACRNTREKKRYAGRDTVDPQTIIDDMMEALWEDRFQDYVLSELWTEVTLRPGDSFYLPAGWAHDVVTGLSDEPHIAMNYWVHPPAIVGNLEENKIISNDAQGPEETLKSATDDASVVAAGGSNNLVSDATDYNAKGVYVDGFHSWTYSRLKPDIYLFC